MNQCVRPCFRELPKCTAAILGTRNAKCINNKRYECRCCTINYSGNVQLFGISTLSQFANLVVLWYLFFTIPTLALNLQTVLIFHPFLPISNAGKHYTLNQFIALFEFIIFENGLQMSTDFSGYSLM